MRIRRHRTLVPRLRARRRRRAIAKLLTYGGAVALGRRFGPKEKKLWQRLFERVPDEFPPKAMLVNLEAIRKQNERIIQLLEEQRGVQAEATLKSAG